MICPNCKNEINDDSRFCRHCGTEIINGTESVIEVADNFTPDNTEKPKNKQNKKTLKIQIIVTFIVLVILGVVLAVVIAQTGKTGFGNEKITDAAGEVIRPGKGTTEMSVMDSDGTVRTIKADRSLLTHEEILNEYTYVMNKLKTDAPAFSFIRYQNLPPDSQNFGAENVTENDSIGNLIGGIMGNTVDFVLPFIEKYVTSESAAEKTPYSAGNSNKLPLPDSSYGCLLTDSTKIKNAYCEVVTDDTYKIVITLNDESNPPILSSGATSSPSAINSVFDTYDALYQITSIAELAMSKCTFNYTDCTVTLVYNYDSKQVQSINMTMNIDIDAKVLNMIPLNARIVDISEYTDFTY